MTRKDYELIAGALRKARKGYPTLPSRFQLAALEYPPGECGYAELEMEMSHAPWIAVRSVINSCRRRGWLDDQGNITDAGQTTLDRERFRKACGVHS